MNKHKLRRLSILETRCCTQPTSCLTGSKYIYDPRVYLQTSGFIHRGKTVGALAAPGRQYLTPTPSLGVNRDTALQGECDICRSRGHDYIGHNYIGHDHTGHNYNRP